MKCHQMTGCITANAAGFRERLTHRPLRSPLAHNHPGLHRYEIIIGIGIGKARVTASVVAKLQESPAIAWHLPRIRRASVQRPAADAI